MNARQRRGLARKLNPKCCPRCGGIVDIGYGLAFGRGFGTYVWCGSMDSDVEGCGWFFKKLDPNQ